MLWPLEALLGEGPAWIGHDAALWFVDIKRGRIHRYDPATGERRTLSVGGEPSFIVPADCGRLLVGNGNTLRLLEGEMLGRIVATIDMPAHNRTNDATVDASGRLWFGTMDNRESEPSGAVHLFDGGDVRAVGGGCVITNGPAISPDGRWLYHVDTLGRTITRFDITRFDMARSPRLENGEVFVTVARGDGNPDGVTVDAEGCLWVALWGGWQVRRYAPDGALLAQVALPCANVTKVAFGGEDLRTAFVTTARVGLSDAALAAQPLAGGLFAFDAPAPGLPLTPVRLRH